MLKISATRNTRVAAGLAVAVLLLAGCGTDTGDEWLKAGRVVESAFGGGGGISLEQAAAVSYASMGIRIGGSGQGMMILAERAKDDLIWASSDGVSITTRAGRIIRTSGLPQNLDRTEFAQEDYLGAHAGGTATTVRLMDFADLHRYGVKVVCQAAPAVRETITILGKPIPASRVDERCQNDSLNWSFQNTFWIGATGTVWRSIQTISPNGDPIELELLRPPKQ